VRCQELAEPSVSYTVTDRAGTSRVLIQLQAHGQQQIAVTEPKFSLPGARKSILTRLRDPGAYWCREGGIE